ELAVIWKHILPGPAARPLLHPFFEILRHAAQSDHRVDARSSAHDPRLLVVPRHSPGIRRRARINLEIRPEVLRPEKRGIISIANPPGPRAGGMVGPRLDDKDLALSVLAQASRQDGAGRTRADDDEVVNHPKPK